LNEAEVQHSQAMNDKELEISKIKKENNSKIIQLGKLQTE
jgi:hypothetical protein